MPASGGGGAPAAGSGAGAVVASAAVFALLLAMTWDALSGCWDMVLENKGPCESCAVNRVGLLLGLT